MAKEKEVVQTSEEDEGLAEDIQNVLRETLKRACASGGLTLDLTWRGHRQVQESVTFGADTSVDVVVNRRNFDVVIVLNGQRYQTATHHGTPALITQARASKDGYFHIPHGLSFRTSTLVST